MKPLFCIPPALAALLCLGACESGSRQAREGGGAWKMPAEFRAPVTATGVQATLAQRRPAARKYKVCIELVQKKGGSQGTSVLEVRPGQAARVQQTKSFPYPSGYTFPKITASKTASGGVEVTPFTPAGFVSEDLGWKCEATVTAKSGLLVIKGTFTETTFDGFASCAGEMTCPIMREDGTVLTDNKAVQPRFTHRESPIIIFAAPGKTYRMDVSSSSGPAWLNITCEPFPPAGDPPITRKLRFSSPPEPGSPR